MIQPFQLKNTIVILFLLQVTLLLLPVKYGQAQNCDDYYFIKGFGTTISARTGSLQPLPQGNFIFNATTYNGYTITKLTSGGDTSWSKIYNLLNANEYGSDLAACLDHTYRFICSPVGNTIISVDTATGQVLAAKKIQVPLQDALSIQFIGVTSDNDKIILAKDESTYSEEGYVLLRLRPDLSSIIWTKHIRAANLFFQGMKVAGDEILLYGRKNSRAFILQANSINGAVLLQTETELDSGGSLYFVSDLHKYNNGYVALISNQNNSDVSKAIVRFNADFQVTKSYYLDPFRSDIPLLLNVSNEGGITGLGSGLSSTTWFLKITASDSVLFMNSSMQSAMTILSDFKKTNDGFAFLTSLTYTAVGIGNFGLVLVVNIDANGNIQNCTGNSVPLMKRSCNTNISGSNAIIRDTSFVTLNSAAFDVKDHVFSIGTGCFSTNNCSAVKATGPVSLCSISSAVYTCRRNEGCTSPVNWKTNSSDVVMEEWSDSTVSVRFLQSGNYELYASIINLCDTIYDTLRISYTSSNGVVLDLGPDRELCAQNTILLNARRGYNSYRWQNGSTDSTFLVNQPGSYYVTVTDACNNTFSDTVRVSAAAPVPLSIGPDRSKCNNDTLLLTAPAGFINYSWGPLYNINSTNTQQVVVNPARDTIYYVKAEKTPGCFGFDTLRVKIYTSPPINLGPDVRFCNGDSVVLRAGNGFTGYTWSNGATSAQLTVKAQGTYSVKATTAEGCSSADTMQVLQVYANPIVRLNKDSLLCSQSTRTLDAGSYASYVWSTGQQTGTITVANTGTYSVTVTDANGCKGRDTTVITRLLPLPSRFLGKDTSICSYGTLELQAAAGYKTYLWSNGATTPKLNVNKAGQYVLTVTDGYNCTGADTVNVALKQCLTGFYMPNAFTPNNDGLNDNLKPFLFGDVLQYNFSIYNRFGELVFTTTDLQSGWNGTVKGLPQDPGSFVWKCSYQLKGEDVQLKSGTVFLVR